jgi:hypothetical protein
MYSQNFVNTNPRFSINYFDIVLLFISHHQLQINDRRTDIQVCRHYNFRRVDGKWSLFIANQVHLLLDFEIILLQIFKTEDLDKIRKETILYIVCEILKLSMFYSLTCDIVVRF